MAEYAAIFGGPYLEKYYLVAKDTDPKPNRKIGTVSMDGVTSYDVVEIGLTNFNLYNSLRLFFANGGGECFIVSCGTYDAGGTATNIQFQDLKDGLDALANVVGPTILVIPDAVLLDEQSAYNDLVVAMLQQCLKKQDRVAVLDVWVDRKARSRPGRTTPLPPSAREWPAPHPTRCATEWLIIRTW